MTTFQRCTNRSMGDRLQQQTMVFGAEDDSGFTPRQIRGAALAGSMAGAVVVGPVGAAAVGASAAYAAANRECGVGEAARSIGDITANVSECLLANKTVNRTVKGYSKRTSRVKKKMKRVAKRISKQTRQVNRIVSKVARILNNIVQEYSLTSVEMKVLTHHITNQVVTAVSNSSVKNRVENHAVSTHEMKSLVGDVKSRVQRAVSKPFRVKLLKVANRDCEDDYNEDDYYSDGSSSYARCDSHSSYHGSDSDYSGSENSVKDSYDEDYDSHSCSDSEYSKVPTEDYDDYVDDGSHSRGSKRSFCTSESDSDEEDSDSEPSRGTRSTSKGSSTSSRESFGEEHYSYDSEVGSRHSYEGTEDEEDRSNGSSQDSRGSLEDEDKSYDSEEDSSHSFDEEDEHCSKASYDDSYSSRFTSEDSDFSGSPREADPDSVDDVCYVEANLSRLPNFGAPEEKAAQGISQNILPESDRDDFYKECLDTAASNDDSSHKEEDDVFEDAAEELTENDSITNPATKKKLPLEVAGAKSTSAKEGEDKLKTKQEIINKVIERLQDTMATLQNDTKSAIQEEKARAEKELIEKIIESLLVAE